MPEDTFSEAFEHLHTLLDYWRLGATLFEQAECFYGHGTLNAKDDAAALICHALKLDPDQIGPFHGARLCPSEKRRILDLYRKRANDRIPVPYITHETWFAGLSLFVDPRVLIPRSPIAEVIENAFSPWMNVEEIGTILDIGTGSGCIAVAAAHYCPHAKVDAVDASAEALDVAKINVERYGLQNRVKLLQSDLFAALDGRRYDIIISNPPYVPQASMEALPREYQYEPVQALRAGDEGLDYAIRILAQAFEHMEPGGKLIMEVGEAADALEQRFPQVPFTWLQFERGGEGVFLLDDEQLQAHQRLFRSNRKP